MAEKPITPQGITIPKLHAWRLYRGLGQKELAKVAGVGVNTISRAEQGQRVKFASVARIEKALGVSREQLLRQDPSITQGRGAA